MIRFTDNKTDSKKIERIARRAHDNLGFDQVDIEMDVSACHANGCPLDLDKLECFPPSDFAHDIHGIAGHLDRKTGTLTRQFLPRCAAKQG